MRRLLLLTLGAGACFVLRSLGAGAEPAAERTIVSGQRVGTVVVDSAKTKQVGQLLFHGP